MIVMKFGGSSIESANAIQRVIGIIASHQAQRPVVVVSAMGKTTDRLLDIATLASEGKATQALQQIKALEDFHRQQVEMLLPPADAAILHAVIADHFRELIAVTFTVAAMGKLTPKLWDAIASFGERLSCQIVAAALASQGVASAHLDARKLIVTDRQHTKAPLIWETYAKVRHAVLPLVEERVPVMGGFIASTEDGVGATLGRGGSDLTASLVGAALWVDEIQIWTDVDGMLSCDPRILQDGHCLRQISYEEAREMAQCGAKVLHPDTVEPAVKRRIPLSIRNSRRPWIPGTRIAADTPLGSAAPRSIASETGVTLIRARPLNGMAIPALAACIQDVFRAQSLDVEVVSHEECLALTLRNSLHLPGVMRVLEGLANCSVDQEQAMVSLVGRTIGVNPYAKGRAVQALSRNAVQVNASGVSALRLTFVLPERELAKATACLHEEFFSIVDPEVFFSAAQPVEEKAAVTMPVETVDFEFALAGR